MCSRTLGAPGTQGFRRRSRDKRNDIRSAAPSWHAGTPVSGEGQFLYHKNSKKRTRGDRQYKTHNDKAGLTAFYRSLGEACKTQVDCVAERLVKALDSFAIGISTLGLMHAHGDDITRYFAVRIARRLMRDCEHLD
jgi:hypothetical protein